MKKHTFQTTKILAVAFTTLTGCAEGPSSPKAAAETAHAEALTPVASPAPSVMPAPAPSVMPAPAAPPVADAPKERQMSTNPALLALARDLSEGGAAKALAQQARYRPLCDADGYPVVGNVMTKSAHYQPSAFCATVRAVAKR